MIEFPGFSVREELHRGPITSVYRAVRLKDYKFVVLKTLHAERPGFNSLARLRREYEILEAIRGQDIVEAYQVESFGKSVVLIMEDIGGASLRNLYQQGPPDMATFFKLAVNITETLGRVHQNMIVHKDINPSNVIFNPDTGQMRLIDFGISSRLYKENHGQVAPNALEGTLAYMSPEQTGRMNRSLDYRSDIYSLGMSFYDLLAGAPPFSTSDPLEMVHCHLARTPDFLNDLNESISRSLSLVIHKMIAKAPEERYQSIFGLTSDLKECCQLWEKGLDPDHFEAGLLDHSDQFSISEKIYGRESEIRKLQGALERTSNGYSGIFLVTGYAGQGKSALVQEIQKSVVARRGYFVPGKFDPLTRDIPYASLLTAFKELVRQVLTESDGEIAQWKEDLQRNLGLNAQIVIDALPELELILGSQPLVRELPTSEAQNRFQMVFHNFVKTFGSRSHPLILFLDDLQWADIASLNMLKMFLTDFDSRYIMVIGSYRTNECPAGHPLTLTLEELRILGANISKIELHPLGLEHINSLLADTLHCHPGKSLPLARLCLQKTSGNPFFLVQLLKGLYEDGHIQYNHEDGCWNWELSAIEDLQVTQNLIDFMLGKIRRLSLETQYVLQLASCIGNRFDLETLAMVYQRPPRETADQLWQAMEEGLILPLDDAYKFPDNYSKTLIRYRFLHDRVYQAAYSMLEEQEKKNIHVCIGRLLFGNASGHELEEKAFEIVNHLNLGIDLLNSQEERTNLARLNLIAGKKAKLASAYDSAMNYYAIGILMLPSKSWSSHHDLTFALYLEHAECQHLCGFPLEAEMSFETIFNNVYTRLEKARVHAIKILVETHLSKPAEAIQNGLNGLALFQITFPQDQEDRTRLIWEQKAEILNLIGDQSLEDILKKPAMENAEHLVTMYLMMNMAPPAYYTDPNLYRLVIQKMTLTSLTHGNAASSSFAFVNYGALLITRDSEFQAGLHFGKLALELGDCFDRTGLTYKVKFVFATFVNHWAHHVKTSLDYFKEAHYYAFESGDLLFASYVGHHYLDTMFVRGERVHDMHDFACKYLDISNVENLLDASHVIMMYRQITRALRGETAGLDQLTDESFDEANFLENLKNRPVRYPFVFYCIHKCSLHLSRERPMEALAMAEDAEREIETIAGMLFYSEHFFYYSLAITRSWNQFKTRQKSSYKKILKRNMAKLKIWATHCPSNFQHKYLLVCAEEARIGNTKWEAMELYEEAISSARGHEFFQIEGLCHELAARFWLEQGKSDFAHMHMVKAHYDYQLWGAVAKAETLASRYLTIQNGNHAKTTNHRSADDELNPHTTYEYLDLNTVIKASQAISGNIILSELLEEMMKILLENAGADKGCLILEHETHGDFRVEAEGQVDKGIQVLQSTPHEKHPRLSSSVVNYSIRTREFVALNDASREGLFTSDPYMLHHRPKSVLCVPIIHRSQLYGLLYLENNLTTGAFSAERLEVLRILASQAAISIRKARLYSKLEDYSRDLEEKVAKRTDQLEKKNTELGYKHEALLRTQKQLILQEKMASIGVLTAGIAHEIRNPLNFINNFARVSMELARELRDMISSQVHQLDPDLARDVQDILESFDQNSQLIDRHGARANQIVEGMLKLSKGQTGLRRPADLNQVVEEYVKMAYHGMYAHGHIVQIAIEEKYDPDVGKLNIITQDFGRALLNMVNNACQALTEKHNEKPFKPILSIETRNLKGYVEICLRDNGPGIPEQLLDKIFNPFFTTKPGNPEHIGLGLSISYDIIRGHQGDIKVDTLLGEFTEFRIILPSN